jgi:hypothetical protein
MMCIEASTAISTPNRAQRGEQREDSGGPGVQKKSAFTAQRARVTACCVVQGESTFLNSQLFFFPSTRALDLT